LAKSRGLNFKLNHRRQSVGLSARQMTSSNILPRDPTRDSAALHCTVLGAEAV
jgi:hypothetical protein